MLSQWPSSGRWATRMAAVNGPTPGTVRYNAARWAREELLCSASWYSSSSCAISLSSQAMWRLVELATAAETPLSSRFSLLDSLFHELPPPAQQVLQFLAFRLQFRRV